MATFRRGEATSNDKDLDLWVLCSDAKQLKTAWRSLRRSFRRAKAAGAIVQDGQGDILVIDRFNRPDLPKGHVEPGERRRQAALREVREECGIEGLRLGQRAGQTYHVYPLNGQLILKTTRWYRATAPRQKTRPQTEESITQAYWMPRDLVPWMRDNTYRSLSELLAVVFPG